MTNRPGGRPKAPVSGAAALPDALALLQAGRFQEAGPALREAGVPWAVFDLAGWRAALERAAASSVPDKLEGLVGGVLELRLADATMPDSWTKAIPRAEVACLDEVRRAGAARHGSALAILLEWRLARLWAWTEWNDRLADALHRAEHRLRGAVPDLPADVRPTLVALAGLAPSAESSGLRGWLASLEGAITAAPPVRRTELALLRVRLVALHDPHGETAWSFRRGLPRLSHLLAPHLRSLWEWAPMPVARPGERRATLRPILEQIVDFQANWPRADEIPALCELLTAPVRHPETATRVTAQLCARARRHVREPVVTALRERSLRFDDTSLTRLDGTLDTLRARALGEQAREEASILAGAFFGEVLRIRDGGAWLDLGMLSARDEVARWLRAHDEGSRRKLPAAVASALAMWVRCRPSLRGAPVPEQVRDLASVLESAHRHEPGLSIVGAVVPFILVRDARVTAPTSDAARRLEHPPGLPLAELARREWPDAEPSTAIAVLRAEAAAAMASVTGRALMPGRIVDGLIRCESAAFAAGEWETSATRTAGLDAMRPAFQRLVESGLGAPRERTLVRALWPRFGWSCIGLVPGWAAPKRESSIARIARLVFEARLRLEDAGAIEGLDALRDGSKRSRADALRAAAGLHWLGEDDAARAAWRSAAGAGSRSARDPIVAGLGPLLAPGTRDDVKAAAATLDESVLAARRDGDAFWRELALLRLRLHVLRDPKNPSIARFAFAYPALSHLTTPCFRAPKRARGRR